jgi:phage FluMu gp28-like protein
MKDYVNLEHPVNFQILYLGQVPHDKQKEVLTSSHKNKVVVCGRRAGKSQLVGGESIRGGITKEYMRQMLIAPTYKQAMIVMTKVQELMHKSGNGSDIVKVIKSPNPKIVFINGAEIDFGSADNPDSLRGENYDRIFLDEAEFIKMEAMNAIRPLIYDTGAPMWITTTPWKRNFVYDYWMRGVNGDEDWGAFNYCYLDNPFITEEGKKEIEKDILEWGEDSMFVQAEIYGKYVDDIDCYFDRDDVIFCVVEGSDMGHVHPKRRYVAGVDCAGEGEDKSVCTVLEIDDMKDEIRVAEIFVLNKNKPRELVQMLIDVDSKYNLEKLYIDKTGLGEGPADWIGMEIGDEKVEDIRFSMQSKMDMFSNLRMMIQKRKRVQRGDEIVEVPTLILPKHRELLKEIMDLRYEVRPNKTVKISHPEGAKYHDDFVDSLALACLYFKDYEDNEYDAFII